MHLWLVLSWSAAGVAGIEVIEGTQADFGMFPAHETREQVFTIRNTGDQMLRIERVRKVCGCLETVLPQTELAPLQSVAFTIRTLANSLAHAFSKTVFMQTNAPKQKLIKFTVSGQAIPLVEVIPAAKVRVEASAQPWTRTFLLRPSSPHVRLGKPVLASDDGQGFEVSLSKNSDNVYQLQVAAPRGTGTSSFRQCVRVPVVEPENSHAVEVVLYANR